MRNTTYGEQSEPKSLKIRRSMNIETPTRKPSPLYQLILLFKPIWAQNHDGVEYEPDGRDLKAAKVFLELHPDIAEKHETFVTAAMRFLEDPFWVNQNFKHNHQFYFLCEHYAKYANPIVPKKRITATPTVSTYLCSDCGKVRTDAECSNKECQTNDWKKETGTKEEVLNKLADLANHMRA
jgi:hypothetical protein